MKIIVKLEEILELGGSYGWQKFCDDKGYSIYAINEGGGDIDIVLTKEEAEKYGVL